MEITGFGEVIYTDKDECPIGLVLRENAEGVVLEKCFDAERENTEVLETFDSWMSLVDRECLEECLKVAREYEPDVEVPIYIKHFSINASEEAAAVQRGDARKTCFGCTENLEKKAPWETVDWSKCRACNIRTEVAK